MVRESAVRGHDAPVHGAPGRRAARHHRPRLHRGARGGGGVLRPPAPVVRREKEHHDVRPVLARPGGGDQAPGDRGHLPRRLGDLGQGLDERGPRARSGELSAQPGARRGRGAGARPAHRRPQPAVPARAHVREAAQRDAGRRLSSVHHRRRRYRPWRRSPRAQPRAALRGSRRARLPHRGPAPGHQEVRPPGRQGPGAGRRADQALERGAVPARRHEGPRHHRRPHRRRGGDAARRPRRRARPAVHPRRHQRQPAVLQGRLPGSPEALLRSRGPRAQRTPALRAVRRGVPGRRRAGSSARGSPPWPPRTPPATSRSA